MFAEKEAFPRGEEDFKQDLIAQIRERLADCKETLIVNETSLLSSPQRLWETGIFEEVEIDIVPKASLRPERNLVSLGDALHSVLLGVENVDTDKMLHSWPLKADLSIPIIGFSQVVGRRVVAHIVELYDCEVLRKNWSASTIIKEEKEVCRLLRILVFPGEDFVALYRGTEQGIKSGGKVHHDIAGLFLFKVIPRSLVEEWLAGIDIRAKYLSLSG